jgi:hypothetical protein
VFFCLHSFLFIVVNKLGTVYCINVSDEIFRWNGNGWDKLPGAAKTVGVGSRSDVWVTNGANDIYHWYDN